ncbi:hypothetical protein [Anabaena azotica]|uniref:Uncharacterized protein n=1 Tax=Anabaena azotica FACHB-119 TaxID=947527 RepID=A0ABR8CVU4_9NOST|nr:hypothetical protein [Anabaena azotica]MBD2499044.1 hypothetical protein [Anabaena azotica FACHB-119]
MEHWQFLIQKQGDRSWHALESPNTEILEGRYRVLARSNLPNQDVEVRVTYFSTQEVPPKRRIQKRSRRTSPEGLMAVIPFTYLKAGVWELRCSGDLISDILGKSWQYGVHLQVKPQLAEVVEPVLEPENNLETISDPISEEKPPSNPEVELVITQESYFLDQDDIAIDQPVNPVWVKGETAEQILQNLIDLALPAESLLEEPQVEDTPKEERSLPLLLTLDQETYITRWGHLLTIHGIVELQKNLQPADEACDLKNLSGLELRIELRSPQSSEVLTQIRQSLGDKSLPLTIRSTFDIPADCESKLILADINLYGAVAHQGEAALLASHSFTITADVADLLAVKNAVQASLVDEQNHTTSTAEPSATIDLELFNLVKTPPISSPPTYPSVSTPLPEVIDPESLNKQTDLRLPQLPKLPETPIEATVTNDLITEPSLDIPPLEPEETTIPQTPAPIDLGKLVIKPRLRFSGSTLPYLKRLPATPSFNEVTTSEVTEELPQVEVAIPEPEPHLEEVLNDTPIPDETVTQLEAEPTPETIAALETEEIVDTSTTELPTTPTQLNENVTQIISITPPRPYSSPLIRKWMESQGYTLPEIFPDSDEVPQTQVTSEESPPVPPIAETPDIEDTLPPVPDVAIEPIEIELVPPEAIEYQPSVEIEEKAPEPPPLEPELPPAEPIPTPLTRIAEEIVLDDSDDEAELEVNNHQLPQAQQAIDSPAKILEPLPIPQLYVPDGELVAGKLTRVRVELPKVSPQVVVKLWMEDCQTRWLLDGPHILTELLPNSSGNLEVMTQISIPFGCLEIRMEAIALNTVTKQESHKVTIIKTVIPPDLPNVSLNDILGM